MSMHDWDKELELVTHEVEQVRAAHGKARLSGNKSLIARKMTIIQAQIELDRTLERTKKLTGREFPLLPRERTLVHWTQIYAERLQDLAALNAKVLMRGLWLKLIKTRLAGGDGEQGGKPATEIDADDLVALSVRQANLVKTEAFLAEAVVKLRSHRKELGKKQEQLGIIVANRRAARTLLVRLGETPAAAAASPLMRSLGALVKQATVPARAGRDPAFAAPSSRYAEKAEGLVNSCRALVLNHMRDGAAPPAKSRDRFQLAMLQLESLEAEARAAYAEIYGQTPAEARPIFVQKAPEQAKR